MFESLQEGILVVTDGAICFKNSIYDKICEMNKGQKDEDPLNMKMFTIYRSNSDSNNNK